MGLATASHKAEVPTTAIVLRKKDQQLSSIYNIFDGTQSVNLIFSSKNREQIPSIPGSSSVQFWILCGVFLGPQ